MKMKLYDLVRPTEKWIVDEINKPILVLEGWGNEERKIKMRARVMFMTSVGYVSKISGSGECEVTWLTKHQQDCFILRNAWWRKEELEVIGNAVEICKDLI